MSGLPTVLAEAEQEETLAYLALHNACSADRGLPEAIGEALKRHAEARTAVANARWFTERSAS